MQKVALSSARRLRHDTACNERARNQGRRQASPASSDHGSASIKSFPETRAGAPGRQVGPPHRPDYALTPAARVDYARQHGRSSPRSIGSRPPWMAAAGPGQPDRQCQSGAFRFRTSPRNWLALRAVRVPTLLAQAPRAANRDSATSQPGLPIFRTDLHQPSHRQRLISV